jgi:hypothetical protein
MRRSSRSRRNPIVAVGLVLLLAAVVASVSCGSSNNNGFGDGGAGGASSGSSADDGGGSGCVGFCSSGGGSSGFPSSSGTSSGTLPEASTSLVSINNCPGTLAASMVTALEAAPANSGSMKWLYPYNNTVFPGGILAPVLQWAQTGTPTGVYIHLHSTLFDYKGCFAGSSPTNIQVPTTPWETAWVQSQGKADPISVELATSTGGTIASSTTSWIFAKGSLAGDVYYNTYGSKLVPGQMNVSNGAVMVIPKGASQPKAVLYTAAGASPFGPCVSCHSLSANGSMLVAQQHFYPNTDPLNGKGSMSFNLTTTPAPNPTTPLASTLNDDWGLSAVFPDGTFLLTAGEPENTSGNPIFPGVPGDNPGMIGPKPSVFYNTSTAAMTTPSGLDTPYAMMPVFSPDGKHLVYNNDQGIDAGAIEGHTLAVADFDGVTTFSNVKQIFSDPTYYPGWPFFTPDDKQVIFSLGDNNNFATEVPPANLTLNHAQLYIVDVASGTSHRLDTVEGYNADGSTYLPFPSRDEKLDFYPTVNSIATGGYFWVYFTSRRAYGNVYQGSAPPSATAAYDPNGGVESDVGTKSIWAAAIDIGAAPGTDPSHPAFYMPGQEIGSGNIRAFPALAPCAANGLTCETGLDCCGGSCASGKCGVPVGCADTDGKCTAAIPCCDKTQGCYGGYCVATQPQ